MIYKCKKCNSESNDMNFGEYCEDCGDISRIKIMPQKREYSHDLIWKKYLEDKCPVCDGKVRDDSNYSHVENGGKCMAKYFSCESCFSRYTVGYNRSSHPIMSEITHNTVYN
jgi:hypothetical protein